MKEILFLCHRIPYPPNKGDKIRAWHMLRALTARYVVHLGTFVDDVDDWQYTATLSRHCGETCYRPLSPRQGRLRSARALLTGEPLSFPYYRDRQLRQWVDRIVKQRSIDAIVAFSSAMGPYAHGHDAIRCILDFVDVDSEKWRQYAPIAKLPMRWIYAREGRKLFEAERKLALSFDASVFVSDAEAGVFKTRAPASAERVVAIPNGVDSTYFDPGQNYPDPYGGNGRNTLVFTGAMDYRANVDAVIWFADEILPRIRAVRPDTRFCIVGARPAPAVLDLAQRPGIKVTGTVDDVRPYLAHAALAVAPLRIARGLQNKVLEALAMDKQVVMTPEAATGLKSLNPVFAAIESDPGGLAQYAINFLRQGEPSLVARKTHEKREAIVEDSPRNYVLHNYGWRTQLQPFLALVEGTDASVKMPPRSTTLAGDPA